MNGYNIINELRCDRFDTSNGIGGGLLVFSKEKLDILAYDKTNDFNQYVNFKISTSNSYVNIVLIYRPPNCNVDNCDKLNNLVKNAPSNTIFIGDFNFPKIDWTNLICENDNKSIDFLNVCIDNNFTQYVDFPTHSRNNILDLVLCNADSITSIDNLGPLGNSDHVMLMINTNYFMKKDCNDYIRYDWNKANYRQMENELDNIDWNSEITDNIHNGWKLFKDSIHKVIDRHVPKTLCKGDSKKPIWMNPYISRLRNRKCRLYKKMKLNNSELNITNYKEVAKELKNAIRRAKRKVEVKISRQSGNAGRKKFSSYVKSKMSTKTGIGPLVDENKNIISDNKGMADLLNDYFCSVFIKDGVRQGGPQLDQMNVNEQLEDFDITVNDVSKKIDELKPGKAPGPDGISTTILKKLKNSVVVPLQKIFQLSLQTGEIPLDWKLAKVVPIFKKGARGKPENQRPVSLTSAVCKLQEGIIREKITDHLVTNELLNQTQHGFMKNKSCQTNLIEFLDYISQVFDEGDAIDVVYLDFSKAFDKISHSKLLLKLQAHGITGRVKSWIENWLTGRKQYVSVNGAMSDEKPVTSGVPQGSVLGPLLFVIFINDLDEAAKKLDILRKFADDTKGGKKVLSQKDADDFQDSLNSLIKWSKDWSMDFNIKKCKIMPFGRRNQNFKYHMNGVQLSQVDCERDIGVCVKSNLKPTQHCKESAGRARTVLGQISRCFHYRDKVVFLRLYTQFVRPHLEFSSSVWSPWLISDIDMLENVQKKAVNMISGLSARDYTGKLKELDLWSLKKRRIMFDMIQVYKIANKIGNVNCSLKFYRDRDVIVSTRNQSDPLNLVKNRPNLDIRKNFFCDRVVDTWNKLPGDIQHSDSVQIFNRSLLSI